MNVFVWYYRRLAARLVNVLYLFKDDGTDIRVQSSIKFSLSMVSIPNETLRVHAFRFHRYYRKMAHVQDFFDIMIQIFVYIRKKV